MRRAWILTAAIAGSACSAEPSFDTGSAASTGVTGTGVGSSVSGSTGAQAISASSAGGSDPSGTGGEGAAGGGSPGNGGAGGEGAGTTGTGGDGGDGGGTPATCGDGEIQPGEGCDLGPDVVSDFCVDCRLECPTGWELAPSGTRCFSARQEPTSWFHAQSQCAAMGAAGVRARLPVPRTQDDLDTIASIAGELAFIGAYDLETEGSFVWLDGTPLEPNSAFPTWSSGQPDNFNSRQDCVAVLAEQGTGFLDDLACDRFAASVCEILPGWADDERCGDAGSDPGEECQEGDTGCANCDHVCADLGGVDPEWSESPLGEHVCYRTVATAGDNIAAKAACGGDRLATPQDLGELAVVHILCDAGQGRSCWLGGSDEQDEGGFVWLSGEPFIYVSGSPPWGAGEPGGGATENCLIETVGVLHDYPCATTDPFPICERID